MKKQIDEIREMARDLRESEHWYFDDKSVDFELDIVRTAKNLYNLDYRKASKVALEVIGEVVSKAKGIFYPDCDYDVSDIHYNLDWLEAELTKKYTEGKK